MKTIGSLISLMVALSLDPAASAQALERMPPGPPVKASRQPAAKIDKVIKQLKGGSRLSCDEVRGVLRFLGFEEMRQSGSHEQWVREGTAFTLACHVKEAPPYILKALKKLVKAHEAGEPDGSESPEDDDVAAE